MSTAAKPEQSKAAAIRAQLPPEIQAKIDENRARNAIVTQIRGTTWAKDVSEATMRAVAEYGHRFGLDPVTELEILGGRIYKNANYYQRRGAELMAQRVISRVEIDQIGYDVRLDEIVATATAHMQAAEAREDTDDAAYWRHQANAARRESVRRTMERVRVNAPEKAAAVVVVRIYTPWLTEPVEGANWAGGGIRPVTKYGNPGDPIGDAEPTKTAETRALRRAWMKLAEAGKTIHGAEAVQAFARMESRIGEEGAALTDIVRDEQAQITAGHEAARPKLLTTTSTDGYEAAAVREPGQVATRVIGAQTPLPVETVQRHLSAPDLYEDGTDDGEARDV